jgi:hypothetical protein
MSSAAHILTLVGLILTEFQESSADQSFTAILFAFI